MTAWNTDLGTAALDRRRTLDRQGLGLCRFCTQAYPAALLRVEYVVPLDQGGEDRDSNLSTICLYDAEDRARSHRASSD